MDTWLAILRKHELSDDATERTEHSTPPKGSLRQIPLAELGRELLEESVCGGPGELVEGQDWEEVAEGVYLLSTHSQSKRTGHVFSFQLRVTAVEKRVDYQMEFGGSSNMSFSGPGVVTEGEPLCRVEVRGGETRDVCVCRTVNKKKKANLSYETAVAEYLVAADDSDEEEI